MLPREFHRRHHVRDARAAGDQRRTAVDRAVPDLAVLVVGRILAADDLAPEAGLELGQRGFLQRESFGDSSHARSFSLDGEAF